MPSLAASRNVDLGNYRPKNPNPIMNPIVPALPIDLSPSPVMISSLPGIATSVDGITRQFNGRPTLPSRRLITPQ